jgi:DNA mismatch repair ATPase MutS
MHLQTDDQTLGDLGIFGKRNGGGIYDIYNRTHTRGGEGVLKQLFLQPLSNMDEINRRSSIIAHFSKLQMVFPFKGALFDMVEKYLANAETNGKNTAQQQVPGEKEIQHGVTALIELLQIIKQFISAEEVSTLTAYQVDRQVIMVILTDTAFEPVFRENRKGKLSYTAVAAYDALFRLREYPKIKMLLGYIYYLDVYLSVAKLAGDRGFIFPKALEKGTASLKLDGVYHPELENPVGNNVALNADKNVIFLTGANMAGKSTFLRSISTALYVAHVGFPVAAKSMEFAVMDGIYTTINLPDNLGMGASHFYSEVLRVKKMAVELSQGKSLFIVFDELFRGTNVKDAHEATVAVAKAFAKRGNSLFFISSHIVEAGEDLKQQPTVAFQYLPTKMNGHVPEYTYKLESGITDDRHGMIIIRNEGILEILQNGRKKKLTAI